MSGIIFSDLGLAASFMALDWVQAALKQALGFDPFPATLNVHPRDAQDAATWQRVRAGSGGLPLAAADNGFCTARIFPIAIFGGAAGASEKITGAILVPEVESYPEDKIEIVAPLRLKEHLGVGDGDPLTWEFVN